MGITVSSAFPSNYLKAADLQGRTIRVTMDSVNVEKVGQDQRLVLYFKGKEKGLVLNKTNANNIASVYGDDTDNWMGQPLDLFPTLVDYQGKSVDAIRVRAPARQVRQPEPPPHNEPTRNLDDEIPF